VVVDVEVLRVDPGQPALAGPGRQQHPAQRRGTLEAGSDERAMAASWASPPGLVRVAPPQIPIRAMFIGAAGVSARRRRGSGTGTRVIVFAGFTAASWAAGSAFDDCLDRAQVLLPAAPYQKAQER
jgi:hypothetical protein